MPELPEVETIVRGLRKELKNRAVTEVIIKEDRIIGYPDSEDFLEGLVGNTITDIGRRGKYIKFHLQRNNEQTRKTKNSKTNWRAAGGDKGDSEKSVMRFLIIHLRMTGKLLIKDSQEKIDKHTHVIFQLDDGRQLRFNNVRKFGRMYLVTDSNLEKAGSLCRLGPEPLEDNFTAEDFKELFSGRSRVIKALLLQQDFVAGLGNIYTDEALFRAGIDPRRRADTLREMEIRELYHAIGAVLREGIKYCGTSISDYVNSRGESGAFQERLKVYQQEGQPCSQCGNDIIKIKVAGRGTHFCSYCQE